MAWDTTMITMLRAIIGDLDGDTYEDERLKQLLVVAATFVQDDVGTSYTISVPLSTISPDPVDTGDEGFVNLVVIKTACMIGVADWKTKSRNAMMVKDDVSSIDGRNIASEAREWARDLCKGYEDAELEYRLGNSRAGHAIIGPHMTDEMITTTAVSDHRGRESSFS